MIPYILHVSILMAGCYIFYWLLLRQETFFKLNRGVLIACLVIPMILPLITIPAGWALQFNPSTEISNKTSTSIVENNPEDVPVVIQETKVIENVPPTPEEMQDASVIPPSQNVSNSSISIMQLLPKIYLTGSLVFALAFLIQLVLILAKITSLNSMQDGKYKIVELVKDEAPYSFWNTIFINPSKYDPDTYNQIIAHEKIHIDQTHFIDMLIVELSVIAFWFNPFAWLFRKAITNNLEFLTDESMLTKGFPKQSYQMSLLKVSVPQYPLNLTTNYNQSFLKNRIAMMNTKRSSARSIWKYLFILPLLGFSMMSLNAVKSIPNNEITNVSTTNNTSNEVTPDIETIPEESMMVAPVNNLPEAETIEEEEPITEENKQLKEEVMASLRNDNLLTDDDPVFKLFPNKILLNERPLNSKLHKKYKAIFKRHGITSNKSRLLIVKPLVIMSGTFVGNENVESGTHVDIFDEEEDEDWSKEEVTVHTVTTTTTDSSTGNSVSITTLDGKTYIQGEGEYEHNGRTYYKSGNGIQVIEEDGTVHTINDSKAVEKEIKKAHEKSYKKQYKQSQIDNDLKSNDGFSQHTEVVTTDTDGETTKNVTVTTKDGRTTVQGKGTHFINGRSYTNVDDRVRVIEADGRTYFLGENILDEDELDDFINDNNQFTGTDKHYLENSKEGHSYFYSASTTYRASQNSLWRLPELSLKFYIKLIDDKIISKGDKMIFYLGEQGAFVNGHYLPKSEANQFVKLARKYGYAISSGFHIEFDGQDILIIDQVDDINYLRKNLLNQLKKDGFISNKRKKMVMKIYGNSFKVNGKEIPNNKLEAYFELLSKHRVIPAPGKTIETSTKKGKKNIQVGYSKDGSVLGTFASF